VHQYGGVTPVSGDAWLAWPGRKAALSEGSQIVALVSRLAPSILTCYPTRNMVQGSQYEDSKKNSQRSDEQDRLYE
jgi:hypothetical protein